MTWRAWATAFLLVAQPAAAAPDFIPSPKQAFEGFVAINAPKPNVSVGALWINGYGPVGQGASEDNLETVRSLNGMTIDKGFQLTLSTELFNLIGIDPRYRDRFSARFSELSIVKVKDMSKLEGPEGEPRIVEAIKAGSIIVSTDGEIGLNGRSLGWEVHKLGGGLVSGKNRGNSIEGRDLFIAVRVATMNLVESKPQEVQLSATDSATHSGIFEKFQITAKGMGCEAAARDCPKPTLGITRISTYPSRSPEFTALDDRNAVTLKLPVPVADQRGGLYDHLQAQWISGCTPKPSRNCYHRSKAIIKYRGYRREDLAEVKPRNW